MIDIVNKLITANDNSTSDGPPQTLDACRNVLITPDRDYSTQEVLHHLFKPFIFIEAIIFNHYISFITIVHKVYLCVPISYKF